MPYATREVIFGSENVPWVSRDPVLLTKSQPGGRLGLWPLKPPAILSVFPHCQLLSTSSTPQSPKIAPLLHVLSCWPHGWAPSLHPQPVANGLLCSSWEPGGLNPRQLMILFGPVDLQKMPKFCAEQHAGRHCPQTSLIPHAVVSVNVLCCSPKGQNSTSEPHALPHINPPVVSHGVSLCCSFLLKRSTSSSP